MPLRALNSKGLSRDVKSDFRKLGLDVRVVNALAAQGIVSLHDLAHITERELASFRGIGPSTRKLLREYLKKERPSDEAAGISLVLPAEYLSAIDDWRLTRDGTAPSRTEAIHELVEIGLAALKKRDVSSRS